MQFKYRAVFHFVELDSCTYCFILISHLLANSILDMPLYFFITIDLYCWSLVVSMLACRTRGTPYWPQSNRYTNFIDFQSRSP